MASQVLFGILGTIALACFITYLVFRQPARGLAQFPGPWLASFSRLYSVKALLSGREHEILLEAHKQYGPIVRWQPNLLIVNDPQLLPEIYHHRANKTPHYNSSIDGIEAVIEAKDWETHRNARRRIADPFGLEAIRVDEHLMDEVIRSWIHDLDMKFATSGSEFDFSDWPTLLVADINMIRLVGYSYSAIPNGANEARNLIKAVQGGAKAVHTLGRLPLLQKALFKGPLRRFITPKPGDGTPIGQMLKFRDDLIERKIRDGAPASSNRLMDHMLFKTKNYDGTPMGMDEIKEDLNNLLLVGSETSGHTILCAILYISENKSCLEKLTAEIDQTLAAIRGSNDDSAQPISYDKASTLPYLKACVRETLRLDPPAVSYLPRYVKKGGQPLPDGKGLIPEGTEVAFSPWVMGRNDDLYGPDADVFRPERFLERSEWAEEVAKYDFAWGYGRRRCLGKSLALFAIYKILFEFFRHFRLDVVSHGQSEAYVLWIYKGLRVRIRRVSEA